METLSKQNKLQKKERVCPLCGELIEHDELVGRRKYHEVCGALLKRITDITRVRFKFWCFVSRCDNPPIASEVKLMWQKMTVESVDRILKKAKDPAWLKKTISQYYKEASCMSDDGIEQKLPYLEESLKAKGEDGHASRYIRGTIDGV
jgi:ribosomal protein S27AE